MCIGTASCGFVRFLFRGGDHYWLCMLVRLLLCSLAIVFFRAAQLLCVLSIRSSSLSPRAVMWFEGVLLGSPLRSSLDLPHASPSPRFCASPPDFSYPLAWGFFFSFLCLLLSLFPFSFPLAPFFDADAVSPLPSLPVCLSLGGGGWLVGWFVCGAFACSPPFSPLLAVLLAV